MATNSKPLDLVDIAVLLLYEWATPHPYFRHTKLIEVAFPGQEARTQAGLLFSDDTESNRTWILLEKQQDSQDERDLPSNMASKDAHHTLSDMQLDTVFYQTRAIPSSASDIPANNQRSVSYLTDVSQRAIMLKSFVLPKVQTCIGILGSTYTAFTGVSADMPHSVMLFHNPYDSISDYTSSLDLASMQFGDAGHSPGGKGKMPFALDSIAELEVRHARLATDSEILAVFVRMHDEDGADGVDYEKQE